MKNFSKGLPDRNFLGRSPSGFTLIELLVVIAIIGILSSIVLASLNTARGKAADVAIKADFAGMRPQAAIYLDNNGSYGADVATSNCFAVGSLFVDPIIAAALTHAQTQSGLVAAICLADDGVVAFGTSANAWAVSVPLKTLPATSWCVDSNGFANIGVATMISNTPACL